MRDKQIRKLRCKTKNKIRIKRKNKTRRRKIYKLKGGFVSQQVINIPYSENLTESINTALVPIFETLPSFSKDLVYISFGSKLNERTLEREYLQPDYEYINRVNAGYQMVPFFLCDNSNPRLKLLCEGRPCRVLNIVIDMFNGEEDLENSKRYITESLTNKRELDASLETTNITQYFVNIADVKDGIFRDIMAKGKNPYIADEHHIFLGTLADILCKKMRENGIDGKNFMLCNYIKFKHPNPPEQKIDKKALETFERVMEENSYKDSYYEWFGYYPMMLYNCIAPPQYINLIRTVISAGALRSMFKDDMKNQMKILAMTKPEFKNQKVLDLFKHILPIKNTAYEIEPPSGYGEDRKNNFCYSVYDLIGE
jgi:hypothetical protein